MGRDTEFSDIDVVTQSLRDGPDVYTSGAVEEIAKATSEAKLEDEVSRRMGNGGTRDGLTRTAGGREADARHDKDKRNAQLARAILLIELNEQLEMLRLKREQLYDRLTEIVEERETLRQAIEDMDADLGYWQQVAEQANENGAFARNPDGSLEDERLEALIAAHEERTGQKIDRDNFDALYRVLLEEQNRLRHERDAALAKDEALDQESKDTVAKIDEIDQQIEETKHKLERAATDPQAIIEQSRELSDKYERNNFVDTALSEPSSDTEGASAPASSGFQFKF
ncbi:MAG: hypothetical protein VX836_02800 [Pseudomonadota bacterium]|nr:hypothetical protein [Pseudomonadota bacterium]